MAQSLLQEPVQSYEDSNGKPLNGGQLFSYSAGTLTPKATYQDSAGSIPNTNPIILNERGEAVVYGSGNYRMILKNSAGATIWDRDNVGAPANGVDLSGSNGASLVGFDDTTLDQFLKSRINRVVDSIAALRGLDKTKYTRAFVTGYYAAGDGGGGAYWYDPSDTTSADNGGTLIVATDSGRWKFAKFQDATVRTFGAKGDGTTDDHVAFQAAIDTGVCLIPYSEFGYRINTALDGSNRDYLMIKGIAGGSPISDLAYVPPVKGSAIIANTGDFCLDIVGSNNVILEDFAITSANQTTPLPNPSLIGIVGGNSDNVRPGAPGGGNYGFNNIAVSMVNSGISLPIYMNNANNGNYRNIQTLGKYGIVLGANNTLAITPPYGTFGAVLHSDGNVFSGISSTGYGDNPLLLLENANNNQFLQVYQVYAGGAAGKPVYTGQGYSIYIKDCADVEIKVQMDYFPYLFNSEGTLYRIRINGSVFSGPTATPVGVPLIGLFNGEVIKDCKFDIIPVGVYPNNNFHYFTNGTATPPTQAFINNDFWFDTGSSPNVVYLNVDATYGFPFINNIFRGNQDVTFGSAAFKFQQSAVDIGAGAHRTFINGKLSGTA